MSELILPHFVPHDRKDLDSILHRPMFTEPQGRSIPFLTYGNWKDNQFEFIRTESLDRSPDEIHAKAMKNLLNFSPETKLIGKDKTKMIASVLRTAPEKILDENYMNDLAFTLKCQNLIVAIPSSVMLYAVPADNTEALMCMASVASSFPKDSPDFILTTRLFCVANGKISFAMDTLVDEVPTPSSMVQEYLGRKQAEESKKSFWERLFG